MTHIVSLTFELSHVVCWISEIKEIICDTIFVNNLLTNIKCFTRKPTIRYKWYVLLKCLILINCIFNIKSNFLSIIESFFCICHFWCLKVVMFLCCNYLSLWLDTCHNLTFHWKSIKQVIIWNILLYSDITNQKG